MEKFILLILVTPSTKLATSLLNITSISFLVAVDDATHLNKLGRRMYAEVVSEYLVKDYKERNAQ